MEPTTPQVEEPTQEQQQHQEEIIPGQQQEEQINQLIQKKEQETSMENQENTSKSDQEIQESKSPAEEETPVNDKTEPTIYEHEKSKKVRASALMTAPNAKRAKKEPREFSFARPTASSASRTAAIASAHTKATPPPSLKPLHSKTVKRTPLRTPQRSSTPVPKTPTTTEGENKRHFNYTPYSGPLPPLTVESSFAPKNSQTLDRGARTASPAPVKTARKNHSTPAKVRNTTGKENVAMNSDGLVADGALNSKTLGSPVSKGQSSDVVQEKQGAPMPETTSGAAA
ncbi:hypothetical protein BBJ29_001017 [Phytophthora kernoviae]|uniref:Uncharacterized protein n=1 Tax=Phytophthora kernoviae TaxID=325452 RepID=A0A3F2S316_9STRA|nr:hypothetical protein BBJ29_001017 [Phytophthora kernoviae]RLN69239.1 hypothetical protein BBP00_00000478 [Phytophthora kernoviae]